MVLFPTHAGRKSCNKVGTNLIKSEAGIEGGGYQSLWLFCHPKEYYMHNFLSSDLHSSSWLSKINLMLYFPVYLKNFISVFIFIFLLKVIKKFFKNLFYIPLSDKIIIFVYFFHINLYIFIIYFLKIIILSLIY